MVSIKIMLLYKFTLVFELYFYNVNLIVHMSINIVNLTKDRITWRHTSRDVYDVDSRSDNLK